MEDSLFKSIENDEISYNSEDYSDVVEKERKKTRNKRILISIVITLLIIIAGYMFYSAVFSDNDSDTDKNPTTQTTDDYTGNPDYISNIDQPLLSLWTDAPKVESTREMETKVKNNSISAKDNKITFNKKIKINEAVNKCSVLQSTDFCLSATGEYNKKDINIFFMNDLVRSRLFENASDFQEINVKGSHSAGAVMIEMGGEEGSVLAIANKDSSGFMIAVPNDMTIDEIEDLASLVSVK